MQEEIPKKSAELQKDIKPRDEKKHDKKQQPPSPKEKKSLKPAGEKEELSKDEIKPKPTAPGDPKMPQPVDTSVDPPKDAKMKPHMPESAMNGDSEQQLKFGKVFGTK